MVIKELVLSGGGVKALSYIGALEAHPQFDVSSLERCVGTSMGSLICCLLAVGYTPSELREIFVDTDWTQLFQSNVFTVLQNVSSNYSVNDGGRVKELLHSLVYNKLGIENPMFSDLNLDLCVIACNLQNNTAEEFSVHQTPTASVVPCVFASMALPLLFPPQKIGKYDYVDGSLKLNFPVCKRQFPVSEGLYLRMQQSSVQPNLLRTFDSYIGRCVGCMLSTQEQNKETAPLPVLTVHCPYSTVHFKLSHKQKLAILECGRNSVLASLNSSRSLSREAETDWTERR